MRSRNKFGMTGSYHAEVVLASRSRNEFGMTLAGQAGKLIQYSDISEINNIEIPLYFECF